MQAGSINEELVRQRAYQICLQRGFQPGHATDDWLQAQYEVMQASIGRTAGVKPRETAQSNREQDIHPNALGGFAWFWGGPS